MKITLNADLGEGEPIARTRAMMRQIDLASIACGAHAGSVDTMLATAEAAVASKVKIGAHPGFPDRDGFGRRALEIDPEGLKMLLISQVSTLATVIACVGAKLHHVKLHGALYHTVESSPLLAATYLETIEQFFPRLRVIARLGGEVEKFSGVLGVSILREAFVDRAYDDYGDLVPRGLSHAMIQTPATVSAQVQRLATEGLPGLGRPDTLCIHGDTPKALQIARCARAALDRSSKTKPLKLSTLSF